MKHLIIAVALLTSTVAVATSHQGEALDRPEQPGKEETTIARARHRTVEELIIAHGILQEGHAKGVLGEFVGERIRLTPHSIADIALGGRADTDEPVWYSEDTLSELAEVKRAYVSVFLRLTLHRALLEREALVTMASGRTEATIGAMDLVTWFGSFHPAVAVMFNPAVQDDLKSQIREPLDVLFEVQRDTSTEEIARRVFALTERIESAEYPVDGTVITARRPLRLRESPNGPVIGSLPRGATVQVLDEDLTGTWWEVEYDGKIGFAGSKYIQLTLPFYGS